MPMFGSADLEKVVVDLRDELVSGKVQMVPELFTVLRVLADRMDGGARFVILGSVSPI
jgi:predicted AAA+ superfamily ATPase